MYPTTAWYSFMCVCTVVYVLLLLYIYFEYMYKDIYKHRHMHTCSSWYTPNNVTDSERTHRGNDKNIRRRKRRRNQDDKGRP